MKKIMSNQVSLVDDIVSEYQGIEMQMGDPEAVSYTHLTLPTICSV